MKIPPPKTSDYELPPAGNHIAVLYGILDLGSQETTYKGETRTNHQLAFLWELPGEQTSKGEHFAVQRRVNFTSDERGNLVGIINAIEQKQMTPADLESYDVFSLIGRGCMLNCVHRAVGEKTYCNVDSWTPLPKGLGVPDVTNDKLALSLDKDEFDHATWDKLTDYWKGVIKASPEFESLELEETPF